MRFAPQIDAARAQLPERIWQTAFADGQSMTLDDAVDYALAWQITAETPAVPRKFKPRNGS
jgi:hypothetical protein